jgi:hypothetical protein
VSPAVEVLVDIAQKRTPQDVAYWLYRYVGERLDEELETLATHFLSEGFEDIVQSQEVSSLITRGRPHEAVRVALSRSRRRTSKVLRDHQRSDEDAFLDSCVEE